MIYVDRGRVPMPEALNSSLAWRERDAAADFYGWTRKRQSSSPQERFKFEVYRHKSVTSALHELFHGKCAYCEVRYAAHMPVEVEHYRPKSGVTEAPGHPGYWWLASTWDNLLVSCIDCGRSRLIEGIKSGKANRFPLENEAFRAAGPGLEANESPLLLNPTVDRPEEHLVFDANGLVSSDTKRGQTTIVVLGLNRRGLVEERRRAANEVVSRLRLVNEFLPVLRSTRSGMNLRHATASISTLLGELQALTSDDEQFAALKRQLAKPTLDSMAELGLTQAVELASTWSSVMPTVSSARRKQAQFAFQSFENAQSDYSLSDEKGRETYRFQRRHIEHVTIDNFKGLESLELDFSGSQTRAGWLMLLGENGMGKSSVLQAIALTLAGADYFKRIAAERSLVLKALVRQRARSARIAVKMSGFVAPHVLTLTATKAVFRKPNGEEATVRFVGGKPKAATGSRHSGEGQTVVLAYGATRLLPRNGAARYGTEFARIDNLFDPFLPLFDAERWLATLKPTEFNTVAIVLKELLGLSARARLQRVRKRIMVRTHRDTVPLKQLSDGYQAVIAMAIDVLEAAKRLWPHLSEAEGVVLLDEIGSHLHPVWKMRIVTSLRRAFPGMQFIATTHEPLCLRGLGEGEVAVMRRNAEGRIEAVTDLPSTADFRVDQLLTSEFFGLNSTVDADVEKLFDEYYALLALPKRTEEQEARVGKLREALAERRYLGNTLREQLMYEAIDKLVARQRHQRTTIPQLKREAVNEVARIWNESLPASVKSS